MPPPLDAVFVKNVICENAKKFLDKELRMTQLVQRLCNAIANNLMQVIMGTDIHETATTMLEEDLA